MFYSKSQWKRLQALSPDEARRLRSLQCQNQADAEADREHPLPPVTDPGFCEAVRSRTEWKTQRALQLMRESDAAVNATPLPE